MLLYSSKGAPTHQIHQLKLAPPALLGAVKKHGVPEDLIAQNFEVQHKFFSLPLEEKLTVLADENNRWTHPQAAIGGSSSEQSDPPQLTTILIYKSLSLLPALQRVHAHG